MPGPTVVYAVRALRARVRSRGRVRLSGRPLIGRGVHFDVGPAGLVTLADGCVIGDGCRFVVRAGRVAIGPRAVLGERCRLVAHAGIEIGAHARLGEQAVVVDFDHRFDDVERPVRLQGLEVAPVRIGAGAGVGHGAAVLRGITVGAGARIGAHAVVTHDVAPGASVGGVPARPLSGALPAAPGG